MATADAITLVVVLQITATVRVVAVERADHKPEPVRVVAWL
jgi:hypothetical protein